AELQLREVMLQVEIAFDNGTPSRVESHASAHGGGAGQLDWTGVGGGGGVERFAEPARVTSIERVINGSAGAEIGDAQPVSERDGAAGLTELGGFDCRGQAGAIKLLHDDVATQGEKIGQHS